MTHDDPTREALFRRWVDLTRQRYGRRCPPDRNDLPRCLADLYEGGEFADDIGLLAVAVEHAWSDAEYPEGYLNDAELWQAMFLDARERLSIPTAPVTLYRGVREDFTAARMSWTGTLEVARWFADLYADVEGATGGLVYVLRDVDPQNVLAQITHGRGDDGRSEDEYVLDPFYLDDAPIELLEDRSKGTPLNGRD